MVDAAGVNRPHINRQTPASMPKIVPGHFLAAPSAHENLPEDPIRFSTGYD